MKRRVTGADIRPAKKRKITKKKNLTRRVEKKNFDFSATGTIVAAQTTAVVNQLFTPDVGAGPTNHVGRAARVTDMNYKWSGSFAATTVGSSPIRLLIVYDKQPNATTPATTLIVSTNTINGLMELSNSKRFKIIVDEIVPQFGLNGPASFYVKGYRNLDLETEFNDVDNPDIDSITTGSYIALTWQNGNIITANPTTNLTTRFRFVDL